MLPHEFGTQKASAAPWTRLLQVARFPRVSTAQPQSQFPMNLTSASWSWLNVFPGDTLG